MVHALGSSIHTLAANGSAHADAQHDHWSITHAHDWHSLITAPFLPPAECISNLMTYNQVYAAGCDSRAMVLYLQRNTFISALR